MARQVHKDVEFQIEDLGGQTKTFRRWDEAAGFALSVAASRGETVNLDVIVWSAAGARAWAGDDGVEQYNEDPEASVFERLQIRVNDVGRVP